MQHQMASLASSPLILVVDDEVSIRRTLEGILIDEGYRTVMAEDGAKAMEILAQETPSLVLLDIWMPGMDGLEVLGRIKALLPATPVVMISGHATIATAISATRLGAFDFIEKPLDLNSTVGAVKRALSHCNGATDERSSESFDGTPEPHLSLGVSAEPPVIDPVVFKDQRLRGAQVPQRTLAHSTILYGQGLHSGRKSGLILEPLPANSGIHFIGLSGKSAVPAHVDFVESTGFATTVRLGATHAGTIEHIMSALHAHRVSNLLIKCNGEVPVMDGSAREFCALFQEVGFEPQPGEWYEIAIDKTIRVEKGREYIQIEPADAFIVDYRLEYPKPVGTQQMEFRLTDIDSYQREIAPARTFGFVKDIGILQKQGLALGGRFDNFILFGSEGAINDQLRFSNEPVRHKILDAIGDLYLLGRPLCGKVTAQMTGHSDNIALLRLLREELRAI